MTERIKPVDTFYKVFTNPDNPEATILLVNEKNLEKVIEDVNRTRENNASTTKKFSEPDIPSEQQGKI